MPYSDFNIKQVQNEFQIDLIEEIGVFSEIKTVEASKQLYEILNENVPLALAINTEKKSFSTQLKIKLLRLIYLSRAIYICGN